MIFGGYYSKIRIYSCYTELIDLDPNDDDIFDQSKHLVEKEGCQNHCQKPEYQPIRRLEKRPEIQTHIHTDTNLHVGPVLTSLALNKTKENI